MKVLDRFWSKVASGPDDCLPWTGCTNPNGDGVFNTGRAAILAHKFAWEVAHAEQLRDLTEVRRICPTPSCVNPDHRRPWLEADRFWAFVRKDEECWNWTADTTADGYGRFSTAIAFKHRRLVLAHRYSFALHNGPIPDGMDVCHSCDNPSCVNPAHLFLGTQAVNNADMVAKRRHCFGERHFRAKLTEGDVRAIRRSRADAKSLARGYGVTQQTIYDIRLRKTWKYI